MSGLSIQDYKYAFFGDGVDLSIQDLEYAFYFDYYDIYVGSKPDDLSSLFDLKRFFYNAETFAGVFDPVGNLILSFQDLEYLYYLQETVGDPLFDSNNDLQYEYFTP